MFPRRRVVVREDETAVLGYNLERAREPVRARLAYFLLGLLALDMTALFLAVIFRQMNSQEAKDLLGVTFPSLVALVGAATGFYYAAAHEGPTQAAPSEKPRSDSDVISDDDAT